MCPPPQTDLHPVGQVLVVVQVEEGVLQTGDRTIGIQQATQLEHVTEALIG